MMCDILCEEKRMKLREMHSILALTGMVSDGGAALM